MQDNRIIRALYELSIEERKLASWKKKSRQGDFAMNLLAVAFVGAVIFGSRAWQLFQRGEHPWMIAGYVLFTLVALGYMLFLLWRSVCSDRPEQKPD